jgi:hypothetical protein
MGWGEQDTKQCKSSRETTFACLFHLQGRKNDLKSQLFLSNGDVVTIYFNGFHGSRGGFFPSADDPRHPHSQISAP